jgi:hypothetical protein
LLSILLRNALFSDIHAPMKEQIAIQNVLREQLGELQRKNPSYSLRAYAKRLGVHVGALSHILNGKRNVSHELAERMIRRLALDPHQRNDLLALFPPKRPYQKPGTDPLPGPRYLALSASQFKIAAEWEHFAVLSLLNCGDFIHSAEWISRRLGITESRASAVVSRLMELGLLALDASGKLVRTRQSYRTPDDVAEASLKKHHDQTLELAKESLYRDAVDERDFVTTTMAIDPKKLSAAKELIRKQQDELAELLESGHRTEVYRFSAQLFPLSRTRK